MVNDVSWGAPEATPLDPGVLSVIGASAAGLAEQEEFFVQQLYYGVVELMPELAVGGRALCERLVRSLLWTATASQSPQDAGDRLRWAGAQNELDGFDRARYADVARALVIAVRNASGDAWDNSMGSAWISYFRWAQPYLLAGAEQATAEQAQAQAVEHDEHGGEPVAATTDLEEVAGW